LVARRRRGVKLVDRREGVVLMRGRRREIEIEFEFGLWRGFVMALAMGI
jgi:hypothetical protein